MSHESLSIEALDHVTGGFSAAALPASARWIMQHESSGNPRAQNPKSTAYGAFQMLAATRKQYMGSHWQSSDLHEQYLAATKYVNQRYGGWDKAQAFWKTHNWY